jgi:hypothetical protein
MSFEGGVMPSDGVRDATPWEVTPAMGKGALGTWRSRSEPDAVPDYIKPRRARR